MKILSIFFILIFAFTAFAQSDKASLNSWRGLTLDESTPEQALEKFKNPKEDKANQQFKPIKYNEWFNVKNNKNFRLIQYDNIEGFKDVILVFLNNKLVAIHLVPEKLAASILPQTYGVDFEVLVSGFERATSPQDYDRDKGKAYPKNFPAVYYLMHKADSSYAFAGIGNSNFGSILGKSLGVQQDDSNSLPGKVLVIQLISRTLENSRGTDLLK